MHLAMEWIKDKTTVTRVNTNNQLQNLDTINRPPYTSNPLPNPYVITKQLYTNTRIVDLTRKQIFRQEDRIYRINKSGFRKRRTPQNDPIGFALIHSRSVLSVSSVVNSAGLG